MYLLLHQLSSRKRNKGALVCWVSCNISLFCVSDYANDPHSPRTVQQGNGAIPSQKPRTYDNQGMLWLGMSLPPSDRTSIQGTLTRHNNSNYTNMSATSPFGYNNSRKSHYKWGLIVTLTQLLWPWPKYCYPPTCFVTPDPLSFLSCVSKWVWDDFDLDLAKGCYMYLFSFLYGWYPCLAFLWCIKHLINACM